MFSIIIQVFWDIQPIKIFCIILIVFFINKISMDGANVNMKFFEEFLQHHKERSSHSLINIGSCGLQHCSWKLFTKRNKIRMEPEKNFGRRLLCSSQFTSTQRRLPKCYWFKFISLKILLNKVILCLCS